jgi:TonB family protein
VIGPDGKVAMAGVAESSSHRLLDEAALEAVRSVAPVPFPSGLPPRALRVRLPVVFDLR